MIMMIKNVITTRSMKFGFNKKLQNKHLNYWILQNETIICIRLRRKVCSHQIFEIRQRLNCYVCLAKIDYSSSRVALADQMSDVFYLMWGFRNG